MSLAISTVTPEGLVLAADSRQSYRNQKGASRIGSDSASKVFRLGLEKGLAIAGPAFLPENGVQKNISRFVEEFRQATSCDDLTVKEVSEKLKSFFETKYQYKQQLDSLPAQIRQDLERQGLKVISIHKEATHVKFEFTDKQGKQQQGVAGVDQLQFVVAGFNPDKSHQVCMVYVPGEIELKRDSNERGKEYGASWIGQIDVVSRIVLGFDPRIGNLQMFQAMAAQVGPEKVQAQLRGLEYSIQWGTMTLQDGIDFSVLAIETTTAIQRFSDGIAADPGDMPGVGGNVDVAVIAPGVGFVWIAKKNLRVGTQEVDLDALRIQSEQLPRTDGAKPSRSARR